MNDRIDKKNYEIEPYEDVDNNLSQDEMIKELIRDYPEDALEFFNPKICRKYGRPVKATFHLQENSKFSHSDPKRINDIVVQYEFSGGEKVVLALIEHWSDKSRFDIHRFAHYLIDLDKRFPGCEKYPVAVFTDKAKTWYKQPPKEIEIKCLDEVYLRFRYKLVKLKAADAERYRKTKNKFESVLRSAMNLGSSERENRVLLAFDFMLDYGNLESDKKLYNKHVDIIIYYLGLTGEEVQVLSELARKRKETKMLSWVKIQENMLKREGKLEGKFETKLETARRMFKKGFSIDIIREMTDLTPEDLEKAGIVQG
ncbi:MAG: hypothetical protein GY754_12010 [bacterium]|nr:hypothetical protein [bacterium]